MNRETITIEIDLPVAGDALPFLVLQVNDNESIQYTLRGELAWFKNNVPYGATQIASLLDIANSVALGVAKEQA
jgi:hypothetical protein